MAEVLTLTFNPCIDKSTSIPLLVPEKKLRCTAPKFEPGGGGINVARAMNRLGGSARALYPAGGYSGKFLNKLLEEENIPTVVVETGSHTRENIIVLEAEKNHQFRFGMPGSPLSEAEWRQCLKEVEKAPDVSYVVASGSLPPGVPAAVLAELAAIVKKKGARLVVDTSGEALQQAVSGGVYLLKPNLGELSLLVGRQELKEEEVEDCARELIKKGNSEIVVVSMGAKGALLVTATESFRVVAPKVPMQSTVGAGDCMVAGLVLSLSQGASLKEALQMGVACGTAATMNPGTGLCQPEDVEYLLAVIR
ncbi:1-phosphofructokinase family hexose kinase [Paraflavisolibacter sp. H34]|uniref:1-phosphofructokinase family hexose kinase n=1 Tax=Huijunlia imazamoxiresistens TaxID=3127457 RepID=UPI003016F107